MKLTEQIRTRLKDIGLSDNAIFEETGVSRAAIHEFLAGESVPNGPTLDRLFSFLGDPMIKFPEISVRERKPGRKPKKT
jgi:transcriptional regulator with XRE-family HTH domain